MAISLDLIDVKLLEELQSNADRPNVELARLVGLSPAATLHRVRRLKDSGIVRGVVARIVAAEADILRIRSYAEDPAQRYRIERKSRTLLYDEPVQLSRSGRPAPSHRPARRARRPATRRRRRRRDSPGRASAVRQDQPARCARRL